jgi:predicted NUDIX family phosphoesterase
MPLIGKKEDLNSLIARLEKYPYTSKPYKELLKAIAKQCEGKYKDQAILCVPRVAATPGTHNMNPANGKHSDIATLFGMKLAFEEESLLTYRPRNEVEYDMAYQQVIACAYVTDGDRYVFLRKNNKSKQASMIGGHVDFDISAYQKELEFFILDNLLRELVEEVKVEGKWQDHIKTIYPELYINEYEDSYDQYNIAVVFSIHVDSLAKLKLSSGEPDKHDLVMGTLTDIMNHTTPHLWVNRVISHIQQNEDALAAEKGEETDEAHQ